MWWLATENVLPCPASTHDGPVSFWSHYELVQSGLLTGLTQKFRVVSFLATLHVCFTSCMLVADSNAKSVCIGNTFFVLLTKDIKIVLMQIYRYD